MRNAILRFGGFIAAGFLFFTTVAHAWPFADKKKSSASTAPAGITAAAPKSSQVNASAAQRSGSGTAPVKRDQENFFEGNEDEEEDAPVVPPIPQIPQIPQVPKIPSMNGVTGIPAGVISPKAGVSQENPESAYQDSEVSKIQSQIREIIKINESLKSNFSDQAAEIQKISEQAKIHEKMLVDLEKNKELTKQANAENFINQEKIKLIQQETQKNQSYLNELKKKTQVSIPGSSNNAAPTSADQIEKA